MLKATIPAAIACLLATTLAHADLSIDTSANLFVNIADGTYNGTLASMACVNIPVSGTGNITVIGMTVTAWLDHTWVGDLVLKLLSPDNTVVTLMSRPGVIESSDDGTSASGAGDSSNLLSTFPVTFADGGPKSAEAMGSTLIDSQVVCRDDAACTYDPNNGAAAAGKLSAFIGKPLLGTWRFCAGDAGMGDTGTIQQVRLTFTGRNPALLQISPQTLDFGSIVHDTTSAVRYITLANTGNVELNVSSITNALPPFQRTADGTCGNSLPHVIPGGLNCTLSYTYSPTTQDFAAQMFTVASNAGGDAAFTLQGSGDAVFADGFEP